MGQGRGAQILGKIVYNRVVQTIKEECKWWIRSLKSFSERLSLGKEVVSMEDWTGE